MKGSVQISTGMLYAKPSLRFKKLLPRHQMLPRDHDLFHHEPAGGLPGNLRAVEINSAGPGFRVSRTSSPGDGGGMHVQPG